MSDATPSSAPAPISQPTPDQISAFADRLNAVQSRIDEAMIDQANKPRPLLLAVSKSKPATDVATAVLAGLRDFGENYLQEALEKQQAIARWQQENGPQAHTARIIWHYIGNVQSNKTRPLAEHFDWVHTISSEKQLKRLNAQRPDALPPLNICLQINIDDEPQKQGISPTDALALAKTCQHYPRLCLRGLMCIPAQGNQAESFKALAALLAQMRASMGVPEKAPTSGHTAFDTLSMGMSADLEAAIAAGSTIVRIGSALFGERL